MKQGFTLIELLITIAILAVLATAVIIIINPSEFIKQGRDSTRFSDLATINKALGLVLADNASADFGDSTKVYVSIPDTSSSCASLTLPSLPSGLSYACASTSTFRNTDGTGWIPVDFTTFSGSSPLAILPVDPINTDTSLNYYTYIPGGSWKLTATVESTKYEEKSQRDGGLSDGAYEIGSDLELGSTVFPSGWIKIPGDSTFDTSDFWVMKYEAKCVDSTTQTPLTSPDTGSGYQTYSNSSSNCTSANGKAVASTETGYPIANISHDTAKTYCTSLGTGFHLITNQEWMTIARNAESISSNWRNGTIGSTEASGGGLYRGNSNNTKALEATSDLSGVNKRTLTLSNGNIIWDIAGNVYEHVQKDSSDTKIPQNNEPTLSISSDDGAGTAGWGDFTEISGYGALSYDEIRPDGSSYTGSYGVGKIYTYGDGETATTERVLRRGGYWDNDTDAGAFAMLLHWTSGNTNYSVGFRCAK